MSKFYKLFRELEGIASLREQYKFNPVDHSRDAAEAEKLAFSFV